MARSFPSFSARKQLTASAAWRLQHQGCQVLMKLRRHARVSKGRVIVHDFNACALAALGQLALLALGQKAGSRYR